MDARSSAPAHGIIPACITVDHGSAVWLAHVMDTEADHLATRSLAGILTGDQLKQGVDVNMWIGSIWDTIPESGIMVVYVMLVSTSVVRIHSKRTGGRIRVIKIDHDPSVWPSGLIHELLDRTPAAPHWKPKRRFRV